MFFSNKQNAEFQKKLSYAPFAKDVLEDYSRIAAKLSEPDFFDKHLKKINDTVKDELEKAGQLTYDEDGDMEFTKKPLYKPYVPHYHVLTDFFKNWCKENSFNAAQTVSCIETDKDGKKQHVAIELPAEMPVIVGLLSDDFFSALLLRSILAKDLGAGVDHGEFTHFLQIYAIVEENKQNKFLQNDPVELIKQSAPYFYMLRKEAPWRLMFDYIQGNTDEAFRNPFFVNEITNAVKSNTGYKKTLGLIDKFIQEFPVLVALLQGRSDKRDSGYRYNVFSRLEPYLNPATKNKYLTVKPGIVLNDAIFFPLKETNISRHVTFDDISAELILLKQQMQDAASIQFTEDKNANFLDNLIKLFSKETAIENKIAIEDTTCLQRTTQLLETIKHNSKIPNETVSFREILLNLLDKYDEIENNNAIKLYSKSLLKVALNILEKARPKLEKKEQIEPEKLAESDQTNRQSLKKSR